MAAVTRPAGGVKPGRPLVKLLARILIMATPAQAKWHVEQQALPWLPALARLAQEIHEAKREALGVLHARGWWGRALSSTTPGNVLYFALEALEEELMGRWILQLPTTTTSAILIGDALWLHRATNPTLIQAAFHRAREALSLPRVEVACNQLDGERLAIPWQPVWKTHLTGATRPPLPTTNLGV